MREVRTTGNRIGPPSISAIAATFARSAARRRRGKWMQIVDYIILVSVSDVLDSQGLLALRTNHVTGGLSVTRRHGARRQTLLSHGFRVSFRLSHRRPHYHTITKTKQVRVPMPVPVPPPPAQVITHVQNVPINASWLAPCWLNGLRMRLKSSRCPLLDPPMWHLGLMT